MKTFSQGDLDSAAEAFNKSLSIHLELGNGDTNHHHIAVYVSQLVASAV